MKTKTKKDYEIDYCYKIKGAYQGQQSLAVIKAKSLSEAINNLKSCFSESVDLEINFTKLL